MCVFVYVWKFVIRFQTDENPTKFSFTRTLNRMERVKEIFYSIWKVIGNSQTKYRHVSRNLASKITCIHNFACTADDKSSTTHQTTSEHTSNKNCWRILEKPLCTLLFTLSCCCCCFFFVHSFFNPAAFLQFNMHICSLFKYLHLM